MLKKTIYTTNIKIFKKVIFFDKRLKIVVICTFTLVNSTVPVKVNVIFRDEYFISFVFNSIQLGWVY